METISLNVKTRSLMGKKAAALRAASLVPGVIYGHGSDNQFVEVPAVTFDKIFAKAGESSLVDLAVDDKAPFKVLIHDVQRDPVTSTVSHVDFYQVKMTEKLTAHIPLVLTGESKAVKESGGVIVKTLDSVTVECLPQDLVHEILVDISKLENFDDAIHIEDLAVPQGIEIKSEGNEMIVTVKAPRTEEEVAADLATPASEASVEAVEVEKKGKKEEESAEAAPEEQK